MTFTLFSYFLQSQICSCVGDHNSSNLLVEMQNLNCLADYMIVHGLLAVGLKFFNY